MATGDSRVTKTLGLSLKKGTYQNKPPKDESYIIKDSDGTLKEYKDDGTKVALGAGGGGTVASVVAGTGISVNATDPANPIVTNSRAVDPGTLFTPGGNVTNWDISPLLGDTDGGYEIYGEIIPSGSLTIFLRWNGGSTAFEQTRFGVQPAGTVFAGPAGETDGLLADTSSDPRVSFWMTVLSKTGHRRRIKYEARRANATYYGDIEITDTVTAITSLGFNSSVASGILSTSFAVLVKRGITAA